MKEYPTIINDKHGRRSNILHICARVHVFGCISCVCANVIVHRTPIIINNNNL